jgi:hypothetical protein
MKKYKAQKFNMQKDIKMESSKVAEQGSILVFCVIIIFIFCLVMIGLLKYATAELQLTGSSVAREQAFQIAEAGVNYYEWHLANFPTDYWDGNSSTTPGPYIHNYVDNNTGLTIGKYSLKITPPAVGSTVVEVQSLGYTLADPLVSRTITVLYGVPSLAQYAFLTNSDAWIGSTESVSGPFFSNEGIRFDGTGNAPIMSAMQSYTCPWYDGCGPANGPGVTEPGIWGAAPQSTQNFWEFPEPNTDFAALTENLSSLETSAKSGGLYLPPSGSDGYSLVFASNGTFNVYKVTSLASEPMGQDVNGNQQTKSIDYGNRTLLDSNLPIPSNGVIYSEDNTWVEGMVNGKVMLAVANLPYNANSAPELMIPNNICFTTCGAGRDHTSSLGLIGQQNILVTYKSPNNLEIDAALIAQNGSAERYYWSGNVLNSITIYGTVGSFGVWTWSWVDGSNNIVSGYTNTDTIYDSNLLYYPPPSFPLSSSGYQPISWVSN